METVMNGFNDDPEFYRGFLPEGKNIGSLTITLVTIVAMWLLVYAVSAISPGSTTFQPSSGLLASHFASETAHR